MARLFAHLVGLSSALVVQVEKNSTPEGPLNAVLMPPRNGVFCRGNGCPYGEVGSVGGQKVLGHASSEQDVEQQAKAALAMGMDVLLARKEFCRGMSCVDGMGKPLDRTKAAFIAQCAHFFNAGGLEGQDDYRSVKNVYDSFGSICGPRVGHAEMPFCRAYGDVIAASLASQMDATTVGSAEKICDGVFDFMTEVKQAQIDLQLFEGSVESVGEEGPDSTRGRRWAKFVELSSPKPLNETHGPLNLQALRKDVDKYEITMSSWDGGLPATKVLPKLFDHCEVELREIMLDKSQTAGRVSKLAVDWCNFQQLQGGRPDWTERSCIGIGKLFALALRNIPDPPPLDRPPLVLGGALPKPAFGQMSPTMPPTYTMMPTIPDSQWGQPPVSGPAAPTMSKEQMQRMLDPFQRFLMRPDQVCQQLFVAIGASTRVEGLLRNSYKTSFRMPTPGMTLPAKDDAVLRAMQQAADFRKIATKGESSKLRQTKAAAALTQENLPTEGLPHASDYNPKVTVWRALSRPQEPVG